MIIGGAVINLSNLIWPDTEDPDEINGVRLHKAVHFRTTAFNLWQNGIFHNEGSDWTVWNMEGGNVVVFVIGGNSTGKSHFIGQNFKNSEYTVLDVYDYQKRAKEDDRFRGLSEREKLFQANELLKADIEMRIIRKL